MNFNNNGNDNHINNHNDNFNPQNGYRAPYGSMPVPPVKVPGNGFAIAAMILGISAIITAFMLTVYLPFILGSLSIVMAILSRSGLTGLQSKAKAGIICSVVALLLNIGIVGYSFSIIFNNPELIMQTATMYDEMIEQMYGVPSEEILGESMEDTISEMYQLFD